MLSRVVSGHRSTIADATIHWFVSCVNVLPRQGSWIFASHEERLEEPIVEELALFDVPTLS